MTIWCVSETEAKTKICCDGSGGTFAWLFGSENVPGLNAWLGAGFDRTSTTRRVPQCMRATTPMDIAASQVHHGAGNDQTRKRSQDTYLPQVHGH